MFMVLASISAVGVGLQVGKWLVVGRVGQYFLVWNLFLAWIPLLLSTLVWIGLRRKGWLRLMAVLPLTLAWILFFPNAPYLVTDLQHIGKATDVPAWYDALTFFSYGLAGLLLGFASLLQMQNLARARVGECSSWLFVLGVLGLSSFGIYLGRVLRWNSWDVVSRPLAVGGDIWERVRQPMDHPHAVAFTGIFAILLLLGYLALTTLSAFGAGAVDRGS
jgi:uncharacterized membrane protein